MAKNKVTDEPEGQTVKQHLLQAALDLFTEKGYAATSVREIVDSAGVTKPVLYYYFKNKEGIYLELFREPFEFFSKILEDACNEKGSVRERLVRLFDRILALFVARIKEARLMYSIYYGPPQGAPFFDFEGFHLKMKEVVGLMVTKGVEKGELRTVDVDVATWILIGALNFVMEEQLCHQPPMIARKDLPRILDLIFDGLTVKKKNRKGDLS
jgi:TetR/AcrR family transcriptional regulator